MGTMWLRGRQIYLSTYEIESFVCERKKNRQTFVIKMKMKLRLRLKSSHIRHQGCQSRPFFTFSAPGKFRLRLLLLPLSKSVTFKFLKNSKKYQS